MTPFRARLPRQGLNQVTSIGRLARVWLLVAGLGLMFSACPEFVGLARGQYTSVEEGYGPSAFPARPRLSADSGLPNSKFGPPSPPVSQQPPTNAWGRSSGYQAGHYGQPQTAPALPAADFAYPAGMPTFAAPAQVHYPLPPQSPPGFNASLYEVRTGMVGEIYQPHTQPMLGGNAVSTFQLTSEQSQDDSLGAAALPTVDPDYLYGPLNPNTATPQPRTDSAVAAPGNWGQATQGGPPQPQQPYYIQDYSSQHNPQPYSPQDYASPQTQYHRIDPITPQHAPAPTSQVPVAPRENALPPPATSWNAAVDAAEHEAYCLAPNCAQCGSKPITQGCCDASCLTGHGLGSMCLMPPYARRWFGGAGALIFFRGDEDSVPLAFADTSYSPDTLTTQDAAQAVAGGFEITLGRYFNCGRNALAVTYWGLFPENAECLRERTGWGDYRSRLPFQYIEMSGTPSSPGSPTWVYDWYDNAFSHTVKRGFAYQNLEVNLLGFATGCAARRFACPTRSIFGGLRDRCGSCEGTGCDNCYDPSGSTRYATGPCGLVPPACGSCLNLTWIAGFRYFHFADDLLFGASLDDPYIDRSEDDMYYTVDTTNDLLGFQTGCRLDVCLGRRLNLYGLSKVGVYNNFSTMYSRIGTDYAWAYLNDNRSPSNPDQWGAYLFDESKDNIAFLSEIGAGLGYRLTCCLSANVGYRAVIASGVATAPGNVQTSFANYQDIRDYDVDETLILHGISIGGVYNF